VLLQRLVEYANAAEDVVPPFYARKPVRWMLDLDADGRPVSWELTDTAEKADPLRKFGVPRLVPAVTRTVGVAPALAVDTGEYVFGWESEGAKPDRVAKQYQAFRDLIDEWAEADPEGPGVAVAAFYRAGHDRRFDPEPGWSRGDLIGIRVDGKFTAETASAQRFWARVAGSRKGSGRTGLCLVCGQTQPLLKTIPQQIPQRWLPGATQSASLVSVNETVHGYELQKFLVNTPVCVDCGLKFMSALTSLLSDPKHSAVLPGQGARLVWWVVGGSTFDPWELLDEADPVKVRQMLSSLVTGVEADVDLSSRYCSVTVSGNVARVVVRDWVEQPVVKVKENLRSWFKDHEMVDDWTGQVVTTGLFRLVQVTGRFQSGRQGARGSWVKLGAKGEDRPNEVFYRLAGAALLGRPLPPRLLAHLVHRVRTDRRVNTARAALIRLALRRLPNYPYIEGLTPTLNVKSKRPAYVCGRIFAIMDDLQRTVFRVAGQNINTTFAERYFGRAIDNPQVVLVTGRRSATAWLKRLRGPLRRANWASAYERRLDELFALVEVIPSRAVLADKAEFILGYHQQRADMRAERIAAAENRKKTDLPVEQDEPEIESEDVNA
jgi:CRISPR-associated protein, Csd1 family